ncbi:MAG TPA: tetratricopeptide repeat protein [Xanthobacteraceae bacterium]
MREIKELREFNEGTVLLRQKKFCDAERLFESVLEAQPNHFDALHLLGTIARETGRPERAVELIQKAVDLNPQSPTAHKDLAVAQMDIERPFDALASCDRAITLDATYAEAYRVRGNALLHLKFAQIALTSLDTAIALEPTLASAHHSRGIALLALDRPEETLASCERALALMPNLAEAHDTAGSAQLMQHGFVEALEKYDDAIFLDPCLARAHFNKALCLLQMGRLEEGLREYEWRKKLRQPIGLRSYSQAFWSGEESLVGTTLFIYWEQGLGDTIQFYRYAKLAAARGARIVMSVQDSLVNLLKETNPEIQIIRSNETPEDFDCHCPLLSLPFAFRTTLATIPTERSYIAVDQGLRAAWSDRLAPSTRPRIGVVWSGGKRHANDQNRSIPLERLFPLFSADADWICLQTELTAKDVGLVRKYGDISFYGDEVKDFADTAALIDLMDLVITVDTGVAHLAGAMGKPVWILLPYNSDWRWLHDRDDSPWYPSVKLYRQQQPGNWEPVISQIKNDLRAANPWKPGRGPIAS